MYHTPILFLIFNRPLETQEAFNKIKEIQPKQLFVAADGARAGNYNDFINCALVKEIIKQVDWDCELKTLLYFTKKPRNSARNCFPAT